MARLDPQPSEPGRVRLRTLTTIRWVGVAGQALAVLVVHYGLEYRLPLGACLIVIGASAAVNLAVTVAMLERPRAVRLSEPAAAWFLAYDIVQLSVLLFLTGGLQNPFAVLLLAPVSVSATILGARPTLVLCVLSVAAISALAVVHMPLPWQGGGLALPLVYVLGIWTSLGSRHRVLRDLRLARRGRGAAHAGRARRRPARLVARAPAFGAGRARRRRRARAGQPAGHHLGRRARDRPRRAGARAPSARTWPC